jgi:zinc protease
VPATELIEYWNKITPEKNVSSGALEFLQSENPWIDKFDLEQELLRAPALELQFTGQPEIIREHLGGEMAAIRFGSVFSVDSQDEATLRLLFSIISDVMSFDLREKQGLAYSMGCWASAGNGVATAGAYIGTRPENVETALPQMQKYLSKFKVSAVSQDKLDSIRGSILGRNLMRHLASINQAWYRGLAELSGNSQSTDEMIAEMEAVTLKDLRRVADKYLAEINWVTVIVD